MEVKPMPSAMALAFHGSPRDYDEMDEAAINKERRQRAAASKKQ